MREPRENLTATPEDLNLVDGKRLPEHVTLGYMVPATADDVARMLAADPFSGHGRSNWVWVRLANGDLMLATFPQGDTYESFVFKV
ncbi:hypothetical protein [Hyphomicrobium sp.]|uniref:hypothetical protein n=1 Tax=Hyphomicrobium sp. TaxID=82 RepID=UPI001DED1225|nr:hypothetical protein [Hyphomicrobium sp.]MBY0561521.1 hypothetical protein [Hyphomicrobium sp.]